MSCFDIFKKKAKAEEKKMVYEDKVRMLYVGQSMNPAVKRILDKDAIGWKDEARHKVRGKR